jgi:hypothetical protein
MAWNDIVIDTGGLMQRLGLLLVALGAVGLVGAGVMALPRWGADAGGLAAGGMFLVILGLVFFYPTMLEDDTHSTSTMRVAVLMVVSLFVVLTVKAGWSARGLDDLRLHQEWVWVLASALGGKAFQSFAENTPGPSPTKASSGGEVSAVIRAAHPRDEREGIQDSP